MSAFCSICVSGIEVLLPTSLAFLCCNCLLLFLGYLNLLSDKPRRPLGQEASWAVFPGLLLGLETLGFKGLAFHGSLAVLNFAALCNVSCTCDPEVPAPLSCESQCRVHRPIIVALKNSTSFYETVWTWCLIIVWWNARVMRFQLGKTSLSYNSYCEVYFLLKSAGD